MDGAKAAVSRYRERRRLAKAARQKAQEEALKRGGPVLPAVLPPPTELAAAPVVESAVPETVLPAGEPSKGEAERRRNRGKRRKHKMEPAGPA